MANFQKVQVPATSAFREYNWKIRRKSVTIPTFPRIRGRHRLHYENVRGSPVKVASSSYVSYIINLHDAE